MTPEAPRVSFWGVATTAPRFFSATRDSIDPRASSIGSVGCHTNGGGGCESSLSISRSLDAKYSVWTPAPAAVSRMLHGRGGRKGTTLVDKIPHMGSLFRSAEGDSRRIVTAEKAVGESCSDGDCDGDDEKNDMVLVVALANRGNTPKGIFLWFLALTRAKALVLDGIPASATTRTIAGRSLNKLFRWDGLGDREIEGDDSGAIIRPLFGINLFYLFINRSGSEKQQQPQASGNRIPPKIGFSQNSNFRSVER